jgi:hypothetical protein
MLEAFDNAFKVNENWKDPELITKWLEISVAKNY